MRLPFRDFVPQKLAALEYRAFHIGGHCDNRAFREMCLGAVGLEKIEETCVAGRQEERIRMSTMGLAVL